MAGWPQQVDGVAGVSALPAERAELDERVFMHLVAEVGEQELDMLRVGVSREVAHP